MNSHNNLIYSLLNVIHCLFFYIIDKMAGDEIHNHE